MSNSKDDDRGRETNFAQVVVHTTSGSDPQEGYERVNVNQKVEVVLKKAAKDLKLTDTSGWLVRHGDQLVNADASFAAQGLSGQVELDWGPEEGGGGA